MIENIICKFCNSKNLQRYGYDKKGKQKYYCKICGRTFTDIDNSEIKKFDSDVIYKILELYFSGMSFRKIKTKLYLEERINITHQTIRNWVMRYLSYISKQDIMFDTVNNHFFIQRDKAIIISKKLKRNYLLRFKNQKYPKRDIKMPPALDRILNLRRKELITKYEMEES